MNGSIIDELKVVISADYSSLKVSLDQGLNALKDFMSEANSGQIDWVNILQGTFTPALIATIASTFALSIEQALNFQQQLQTSSLNTTQSLQSNAAAMTNGIYAASSATGESATDIAAALAIVGQAYKDTGDQTEILGDLSEYAATEGITVTQAATDLIPMLEDWGTTAGNAGTFIDAIGQSAADSKIPLSEMIQMLTQAGPAMKAVISPQAMISQLVTASQVPGFTPADIANFTNIIVTGVQNAKSPVNQVFGDMKTFVDGPNGLGGAMDAIQNKILAWGPAAVTLGPQFGVLANTVSDSMDAPANAFANINALAKQWLLNLLPLKTWFDNNKTTMTELKILWATIISDLQVKVVPAFITDLLSILSGADKLLKIINGGTAGAQTFNSIQAGWNQNGQGDLASIGTGLISGGTAGAAQAASGTVGLTKDSFMEGIGLLIGVLTGNTPTIWNRGSGSSKVSSTAYGPSLPSSNNLPGGING